MKRIAAVGLALGACVPQGKYVPLGIGDLVHTELKWECQQAERDRDSLKKSCSTIKAEYQRAVKQSGELVEAYNRLTQEYEAVVKENQAFNSELLRVVGERDALQKGVAMLKNQRDIDLQETLRSLLQPYDDVVKLYLHSLGLPLPFRHAIPDYVVADVLDILVLDAFIQQSEKGTLNAAAAKEEIKKSFVELDTDEGHCTGVMLTNNGYFVTANHCVPDDPSAAANARVNYDGRWHSVQWLSFNKRQDIRLGKANVTPASTIEPLYLKLAPSSSITPGADVTLYGTQSQGEQFLQMGKIVGVRRDIVTSGRHSGLVYDTMITSAQSRGGFSGGPIYLEATGEIVGITLYSESNPASGIGSSAGGARSDSILEMLVFERDSRIKELKRQYGFR